MNPPRALCRRLEIALAFARAAVDDPTRDRMTRATRYAANVYPDIQSLDRYAVSMHEARQILLLLAELRAVIASVARAEAMA